MLNYANDTNGALVSAIEAESGKNYLCPVCGCSLYRTHRREKCFFACMPGQIHTQSACKKMDEKKTIINPQMTDCDQFHKWLLTEQIKRGGNPGLGGGRPRPHLGRDGKEVPIRTLADVHSVVLLGCGDIKIKNGVLSDLLIITRFADKILKDNASIGPRVIQAIPDGVNEDACLIRFVFCGTVDGELRRKVFLVYFLNKETFLTQVAKLFRVETDEAGKKRFIACNKSVLVHGEWKSLSSIECSRICNKHCNGKWACTGCQCAHFVSERQLYWP